MGASNRYYCSPLCGGWTRTHRPLTHGILVTLDDLRQYLGDYNQNQAGAPEGGVA